MDSAYEELELCSVCFQPFNDVQYRPMLLPCMHTICKCCVSSLPHNIVRVQTKTSRSYSHNSPSLTNTEIGNLISKESHCPFCRKTFNHDTVQDNRYILVHLRQMKRVRNTQQTPVWWTKGMQSQASAPPKVDVYDEPPSSNDLMWCTVCERSASQQCNSMSSHVTIPFVQYINSMKESAGMNLANLEMKACTLSSCIHEMEQVLKNISTAFSITTKGIEAIKCNMEDLKSQVKDLSKSCDETNVPTESDLYVVCGELFKKIGNSSEWLLKYMSNMEKKVSAQNIHEGNFKIDFEDKKITVTSKSDHNTLDVSITIK